MTDLEQALADKEAFVSLYLGEMKITAALLAERDDLMSYIQRINAARCECKITSGSMTVEICNHCGGKIENKVDDITHAEKNQL